MYRTPYAAHDNMSDLRGAADIVEELNPLVTYIGFCQQGTTGTNVPKWSILKITQSGTTVPIITKFEWAAGICSYNLIWDNRAVYEYSFRKF
jgi:hypothetical protein